MLRLGLACALLSTGAALRRTDPWQGLETEPALEKKAFGPERRACSAQHRVVKKACDPNATRCGKHVSGGGIIGGQILESAEVYPFLAWIGDNDGSGLMQFCGGTLVHERVVLTAGHCLYGSDEMNKQIYVRFGVTDYAKTPGAARSVINWKRHSGYNSQTLKNDLTLFLLNASAPSSIRPVRVSDGTQRFEKHGDKVLLGWGSMDEECEVYDSRLRQVRVPIGDYGPSCSTVGSKVVTWKDDFSPSQQLCAGDYGGSMHYPGCGDSGGPLLAGSQQEGWTQVGMVSWSYGVPYPDVFTRVSAYREWLEESVAELLTHVETE